LLVLKSEGEETGGEEQGAHQRVERQEMGVQAREWSGEERRVRDEDTRRVRRMRVRCG